MNWLKAIASFIRRLFGGDLGAKIIAGIEAAAPYVRVAYEMAEYAARMTPNRSDDEILALARALGVPALLEPGQDKGVAIGRIVYRALKMKYPDAADRVLNRAIEIAYGAVRP